MHSHFWSSRDTGIVVDAGHGQLVRGTDRATAIPPKVKIVVGDDTPQNHSPATLIAALPTGIGTSWIHRSGTLRLVAFQPKIPATSSTYRLQRITIENQTLGLRWSADAKANSGATTLAPAEFTNVIAGPNDVLTVTHNRGRYAVVSLFGHGIGVYDVNAIEIANDHPHRAVGVLEPKEESYVRGDKATRLA